MEELKVDFQALDLRQATENEYAALSEFKNKMNLEYRPDDPPIPLEEHIQGWKTIPGFIEYEAYASWDGSDTDIIAYCQIEIYHTGDNEHIAEFTIEILPEYRHRGIGQRALQLILPFAQRHKRTLLISFATDHIASATLFLERLGARRGLETRLNQLKLVEFDRSLVNRWLEQSKNLHTEFELRMWEGAYPEERISEIADLFQELANDQPRDNLEMEDWKVTPEFLRQVEQNMFARGNKRWTMYIIDRANGNITGLTEVSWNPNRAMILNQGFTAVMPIYRSKGLGRWLKAEMMQKILRDRPEVQFIRTGNANSNAPMLKINNEMGFQPYIANTIWQVETEKIEKYLLEKQE
jgi:mycothiol synthase